MSMLKLICTKLTFFVVQQEPSGGCQRFQPDFSVGRTVAETATQLALDNNVNISTGSEYQTRTSECSFEELFDYVPVTCTEVQYIIPSMPSNKFPGPDKISVPMFMFNNFIGAINYFKIISTISTGPKGKVRTRLYRSPMRGTSLL